MKGEIYMNKLFNKITTALVGVAFAIGVGVAAVSSKEAAKVESASAGDTFSQISSASDLTDGSEIIIVNTAETYAVGTTQNDNNRAIVTGLGITNHSWSYNSSKNVQTFIVKKPGTKTTISNVEYDNYGFHTGSGYLYSASNTKNYLRTNTTAASTNPSGTSAWALISVSNSVFTFRNSSNTSYYLQFYGTSQFSQYKNTGTDFYIYKKATSSTCSVTYDDNGSTSGSVPVDGKTYSSGATVTVLGNTGSLSKSHYAFGGWNTQADGNGTNYAAGATFTISSNTTLYAKWTQNEFQISYDPNGGSGTITDNNWYKASDDVILEDCTFTAPTGKEFLCWNTEAGGGGTNYDEGETINISSNTTVYAQWVYADEDLTGESWSYTFGSKIYSSGSNQRIRLNGKCSDQTTQTSGQNWTLFAGTSYYNYESDRGQQIGSGSDAASSVTLSSSSFSSVSLISAVTIYTAGASSINGSVSVSVNSTAYSYGNATSAALTTTNTGYKFTGNTTGDIVISWTQSTSKAIYFKKIVVEYSLLPVESLDGIGNIGGYVSGEFGGSWDTSNLTLSGTINETAVSDITGYVDFTISPSIPTDYETTLSTVTVTATPKDGVTVGEGVVAKTFNNVTCNYTPAVKGKYSDYPLTVSEMITLAPSLEEYDCYYTHGIVASKSWEEDDQYIYYYITISDDGSDTDSLEVWSFNYLEQEEMTEEIFATINEGDEVTVYGSISEYEGDYYYCYLTDDQTNCYLTQHDAPYNPDTDELGGRCHLATSVSQLVDDAVVAICVYYNNNYYSLGSSGSNNFSSATVTMRSGTDFIDGSGYSTFTVSTTTSGNNTYYSFSVDDNGTTKYLSASGGTKNNRLTLTDTQSETTQFSVSLSNGNWSIVANFSGTDARNTMMYNTSSDLFSCYKSSYSTDVVKNLKVFVLKDYETEANEYATAFNNANVCGTDDNTKASGSIWASQSTAFGLLTDGAQYLLTNGTADAGGNALAQCLARYDRVIYLHYATESATYNDFMKRIDNGKVTPKQAGIKLLDSMLGKNSNSTISMIIISTITLASVGAYFFLRKKKED